MGCNSVERVVLGDFVQVSLSETSKLERVFNFLEVSSSACFLMMAGFSPQTSARQMLHPEDRRSSAGCVQLLLKRGATEPSSLHTVKKQKIGRQASFAAHAQNSFF